MRPPVRRCKPIQRTTAPTRYATEWPSPKHPDGGGADGRAPPPIITAMPTSPETIATSAGVRVSPSA